MFRHASATVIRSALAAALLFLALSSSALAHMGVESSDPQNASTVENSPDQATITFNADVEIETAAAQLRYLGALDTPISEATRRDVRTERLDRVEASGRTAVFDLPELEEGLYAIDWAVNEQGGHSNTSFILFKVDPPTTTTWLWVAAAGAAVVAAITVAAVVRTGKR